MLRRAVQRARLHLPAPIGHDNGSGCSSDEEDSPLSPSVAYTSLRDDEAVQDHFRRLPEDISGVHLLASEEAKKAKKRRVAELSDAEQRRAADAWARLQTLYGLFRELEVAEDDVSDTESVDSSVGVEEKQQQRPETRRRRRKDDGLRSLLQEVQLPSGVIFRDLQTLARTDGADDDAMPQGFTPGMFASLGNVMYHEMIVAAEQNRISPDALKELGNCLYAEAANVAVSATA